MTKLMFVLQIGRNRLSIKNLFILNLVKIGYNLKIYKSINYPIQLLNTIQQQSMADTQRTTTQQQKQINWNEYNYPPILNLMHFRPSQLPQDRKTLVMLLFAVHIAVLINTILNIIDDCIEGGIVILYGFLFFFMFNPIVLFLFYRGYMGLCKDKSKLSLYIYIQPLVIIFQIVISIVDFLGFNGFIRVSNLFKIGASFTAVLALIISLIFILVAFLSGYIYFLIWKKRSFLSKALL